MTHTALGTASGRHQASLSRLRLARVVGWRIAPVKEPRRATSAPDRRNDDTLNDRGTMLARLYEAGVPETGWSRGELQSCVSRWLSSDDQASIGPPEVANHLYASLVASARWTSLGCFSRRDRSEESLKKRRSLAAGRSHTATGSFAALGDRLTLRAWRIIAWEPAHLRWRAALVQRGTAAAGTSTAQPKGAGSRRPLR